MSDLIASLLSKRGITLTEDVERFLNPDYERDTHSPFLLEGMERAVARLLTAIAQGERVAVYADFDCDGIPGAVILSDFFERIGYANREIYIPHRDREGYGFHKEAIDELSSGGVSLIITIDLGTNATEAVDFAKQKGIDVIVTDHHEQTGALPDAVAVINPKLGEYPFRDLCGAAVAFKLVQATLAEGKKRGIPSFTAITDGWEKWLLDMVALATVADLVPLVGENRALAHYGLRVLRKSPRPGILALVNRLRLRQSELAEDDIAFSLAPRINAASRMGEPESAFLLLSTKDGIQAEKLAAHLEELNTARKTKVALMVREAKKRMRIRYTDEKVVVLGDTNWSPTLVGLVANSLMESRGGVVCVWGRDGEGRLRGSCRSDGSISITELFTAAGDCLEESGGHEKSGGFSVSHERVHMLPEKLAQAAEALEKKEIKARSTEHDGLIALSEASSALFDEVSRLAPFGIGNPKPLFLVADVIVTHVRRFGKESAHLELSLEDRRSGARARAFDFFRSSESFTHIPLQGGKTRVLATLERDSYRGGFALRLRDVLNV